MSTHRHIRASATALTIAALLGAGALAGCGGAGSSSTAAASATATGAGAGTATAPASGTASAPTASATPVPKAAPALLSGALAALRSAGSVHVETDQSSSQGALVFSDDSTASGGRQVITLGTTGRVTILFIAGVGYIQANSVGLADVFQVPQQQADEFAGQWIELRPGDKLGQSTYDDVTAGITLSSLASELTPSGAVSLGAPSTVKGQRVLTVREPIAASAGMPATAHAVLYVTDATPVRPVLSEVTNAGSSDDQVYFTNWGETVHLTAPAHAVPASDVTPASTTA
jgi:hypothetical protein